MIESFRILTDPLDPALKRELDKLPAASSYRIPFTKKITFRASSWWMGLQWYNAKHVFFYCIEIDATEELQIPIEYLYTDTHSAFMLKGQMTLHSNGDQLLLSEHQYTHYIVRPGTSTLFVDSGRHIIVGFTIARSWTERYRSIGLDFLPTLSALHPDLQLYASPHRPISMDMMADILSLLTLPSMPHLLQDTAIYRPIANLLIDQSTSKEPLEDIHPSKMLVLAVRRYITQALEDGSQLPPISAVAAHFHVHPDVLSRYHRQYFRQPLQPYVLEQRLEKAKQLLAQGITVGDVAFRMGFSDTAAFSKSFKKFFGLNPSEFSSAR